MNNTFDLLGRWIGLFSPSLLLAWPFGKASSRHVAALVLMGQDVCRRMPFCAAALQQRCRELLYSLTFMTWHRIQQMPITLSLRP